METNINLWYSVYSVVERLLVVLANVSFFPSGNILYTSKM